MSNSKINVKYCVLLPIVLTVTQQRTIAIFAFAALMWIFEIVPNWVTSLMVIVISLLTISTKSISFCMNTGDASQFVPMKELMRAFSDPVVMLFLGGFVLAIVAAKYGMDVTMARILLKPFGKKPKTVLLGVLIVISVFSMFMSNTATAAMFLAFLAPVFASLPDTDKKGKIGIALAIPIAANIGGIGTPIGNTSECHCSIHRPCRDKGHGKGRNNRRSGGTCPRILLGDEVLPVPAGLEFP